MTKDVKIDIPIVYKKYIYNNAVGMYNKGYPIDYITKEIHNVLRKYIEALSRSEVRGLVYKSIYDYVMKQKQQGN